MRAFLQEVLNHSKDLFTHTLIQNIDSVAGGSIHSAWRVELDNGQKLFAKTTSREDFPRLSFEAQGLNILRKFTSPSLLVIPKPLVLMVLGNNAVLLLPWLDLDTGNQRNLGKGLASMHQSSNTSNSGRFGFEIDGFIGSGPQPRGWDKNWGKCFVNLRLVPQIKLAKKWGLNIKEWEKFLQNLESVLNHHKPTPSIVHGDLWGGNAANTKNGKGVIFDPAVWWADREVDLAMTKLFGGFSKEFYIGYETTWPLPTSYNERIEIYNLYHLLNHANIFGGSYINQTLNTLRRISKEIN